MGLIRDEFPVMLWPRLDVIIPFVCITLQTADPLRLNVTVSNQVSVLPLFRIPVN